MPVVSLAAAVASPESTLRAAASASMASFLPRRARRCGCGWLISITRQPRSSSDRVKSAPNDPVDSTPTAAIWPNDASHMWAERYPAPVAGNDSVPRTRPNASSAATTWKSVWQSIPPITAWF